MNQKVMQNNFKKEHKVDQRSKNISMKQNNGSLKKSNFWGAFIMKLTYEDKVQIYELRKQGESFRRLSNQFGINIFNLQILI